MNSSTKIKGIDFKASKDSGVYICYIEDFSPELMSEIRNMLSGICYGQVVASEPGDYYSYKETLREFLRRYKQKKENTRKGMIGELLAHLLIPKYINNFQTISIMNNKEESGVKKGFDVVYYDNEQKGLWYSEVKSGGDKDDDETNRKNIILLNRAKSKNSGILSHISEKPEKVFWDSVLDDVKSTVFDSKKVLDIKKLLKSDYSDVIKHKSKNVLLSSVLYKALDNKICPVKLGDYKAKIKDKAFDGVIIFSIQKPTYKKIESFLEQEINS
ncbi:MAG: SAVED domain-containing protein [Patescibacteria group bacterium]|nr:SAVED domain-containing protein [Patescibacteria group bacterium]